MLKNMFQALRHRELLIFLGAYVVCAVLYWVAIYINVGMNPKYGLFFVKQISVNYGIKLLLTIPVWWLLFKHWQYKSLTYRLLWHIPLTATYVGVWFWVFHLICDFFGIGYMRDSGAIWDIYITFLIYVVQFGLMHTYEYVQKEKREMERAKALSELALKAEVSALKARIQPHFLFNTLNSISASVPPEQEYTRELIARLADTFRFGLRASQHETLPLKDELAFLDNYLALEQQRHGPRLRYTIDAPGELGKTMVPPMLLQPLVENAVRHAVEVSIEPVDIRVKIYKTDKYLHFEVSDTGPCTPQTGMPDFTKGGIGLQTTRMRLKKQFDTELKIDFNQAQGLIFTFALKHEHLTH